MMIMILKGQDTKCHIRHVRPQNNFRYRLTTNHRWLTDNHYINLSYSNLYWIGHASEGHMWTTSWSITKNCHNLLWPKERLTKGLSPGLSSSSESSNSLTSMIRDTGMRIILKCLRSVSIEFLCSRIMSPDWGGGFQCVVRVLPHMIIVTTPIIWGKRGT